MPSITDSPLYSWRKLLYFDLNTKEYTTGFTRLTFRSPASASTWFLVWGLDQQPTMTDIVLVQRQTANGVLLYMYLGKTNPWHTAIQRGIVMAVNFLTNIPKSNPISRPLGRGMGCLLWVQPLIDILSEFLQFLQYLTLLQGVIKALDCLFHYLFCYPNSSLQHCNMLWHFPIFALVSFL